MELEQLLKASKALRTGAALTKNYLRYSLDDKDKKMLEDFVIEQESLANELEEYYKENYKRLKEWGKGNTEAIKNYKPPTGGGVTRDPEIYVNMPDGTTKLVNSEQEKLKILENYAKDSSGG